MGGGRGAPAARASGREAGPRRGPPGPAGALLTGTGRRSLEGGIGARIRAQGWTQNLAEEGLAVLGTPEGDDD